MNPQKVFKNENQSRIDSFLIYFSESAGTKANERKDETNTKTADEDSELSDTTLRSIEKSTTTKEQLAKIMALIKAPDDASKCVPVQGL